MRLEGQEAGDTVEAPRSCRACEIYLRDYAEPLKSFRWECLRSVFRSCGCSWRTGWSGQD